jgi:uncharacterized protein (DUF362 family)/UDP-2,3-diacylglucosamine pyrophosphatase LpxH
MKYSFTSLLNRENNKDNLTYVQSLEFPLIDGDIYVVSDLHLASGIENDAKYAGTENFFFDKPFSRFIQYIKSGKKPAWFVINGDFIDFLRITQYPKSISDFDFWQDTLNKVGINKTIAELENSICDKEIEYGLKTNDYKSVWKLLSAKKGHPEFFSALAKWLIYGNYLVIVKGNHDLEWYWGKIRSSMRLFLAENIATLLNISTDDALTKYIFPKLYFTDRSIEFEKSIYIEHGNLYDKLTTIKGEALLPNKAEINLPFGSFFNRYLLNKLEMVFPFQDNVRPRDKILPLLIRDHFPLSVKVFFKHIPFMFQLIPKGYFWFIFRMIFIFTIPVLLFLLWLILTVVYQINAGEINLPELKVWIITPLKAVILAVLSYLFVKIIAYFKLKEPDSLTDDAKKIIEKNPDYRFVVFGHTHNPDSIEYNGCWVYNTGTWVPIVEISTTNIRPDKTFTFVHLIKTADGKFKSPHMQRWNDDSGRIEPIVLIQDKNNPQNILKHDTWKALVSVTRGNDKIESFKELLNITKFDETILNAFQASEKERSNFKIIVKPNMMVFVNQNGHTATVTDKDLVEYLIDHLISLGFTDITVCEAQHDVGRMLNNHNVKFISEQIGYKPNGRYKIVDLTLEMVKYRYTYIDKRGKLKKWKDTVGISWRDADFRISFAKCKTHEHDWMTLSVKNIYGCFPNPRKVTNYHMKNEVWEVTSRSIRNFPVHFAFVDGWISSDGFQGYKIPHPKDTKILFGGNNAVAVDMEIFKRAGLDYKKSRILNRSVKQLYNGQYPDYEITGDTTSYLKNICNWINIDDKVVEDINLLEEVYIDWGFINLTATMEVDYNLFPPKNRFNAFLIWLSKQLYKLAWCFKFYKRLYGDKVYKSLYKDKS